MLKTGLALLLAIGATLTSAPPARADVNEFLDEVRRGGWWGTDATLLQDGMMVCTLRHQGLTERATERAIYELPQISAQTTEMDMQTLVDFAEMNFCDSYFDTDN
jgi:hypothetical protein